MGNAQIINGKKIVLSFSEDVIHISQLEIDYEVDNEGQGFCPNEHPWAYSDGSLCCKSKPLNSLRPDCPENESLPCSTKPCRNAPGSERKAEINFTCGSKYEVTSVKHPETCSYVFTATYPC